MTLDEFRTKWGTKAVQALSMAIAAKDTAIENAHDELECLRGARCDNDVREQEHCQSNIRRYRNRATQLQTEVIDVMLADLAKVVQQ